MKRRLVGCAVGVLLGLGTLLPSSSPAAAFDIGTVIKVVQQVYGLYKSFQSGGQTLDQATAQIIAAINSAKADIITEVDKVAAAQAKACAEAAVVNFASVQQFNPTVLQQFAIDTTNCVTTAESLQTAVSDPASIDSLGFSMDTVGPLALMARARAGFANSGLVTLLVQGNQNAIALLAPSCDFMDNGPEVPPNFRFQYFCVAYNGDQGFAHSASPDDTVKMQAAAAKALRNTSAGLAMQVLPSLQ